MTTTATAPLHAERSASFTLPLPLFQAFPLFTPEGERAYVPGWDPEYLHPTHPSAAAGTVFRTRHDGEETLWLVLEHDPCTGSAAYGRFTPGSRIGTVRVRCEAAGFSTTRVTVSYALTATAPAGNAAVAALTAEALEAKLAEWREAIVAGLAAGPATTGAGRAPGSPAS